MHDDDVEVDQDPGALALGAARVQAAFAARFDRAFEHPRDRHRMAVVARGRDDEVVGDDEGAGDIEDGDVLTLLHRDLVGDVQRQVLGVDRDCS